MTSACMLTICYCAQVQIKKMEDAREKRASMWAGRAAAGIRRRLLNGKDRVMEVALVSLGCGADLKAATETGEPFENSTRHPSDAEPVSVTDGAV